MLEKILLKALQYSLMFLVKVSFDYGHPVVLVLSFNTIMVIPLCLYYHSIQFKVILGTTFIITYL